MCILWPKVTDNLPYYTSISRISIGLFEEIKETNDLNLLKTKDISVPKKELEAAWNNLWEQIIEYRLKYDPEFNKSFKKRIRRIKRLANATLNHRAAELQRIEIEYLEEEKQIKEIRPFHSVLNDIQDIKRRSINEWETSVKTWLMMVIKLSDKKEVSNGTR